MWGILSTKMELGSSRNGRRGAKFCKSRNRTPNVTGSETEFNSREHKVLKWTQERKEQFERVKSIVKTLYRNCTF